MTGYGKLVNCFQCNNLRLHDSTNVFSAGILSGIVIIPGTAGGIFLGSYLIKRVDVRRSCKIAAKYCFIFQFIGTWAVLTFLIPGCKTTLLAGISHPYNNRWTKKDVYSFIHLLLISLTNEDLGRICFMRGLCCGKCMVSIPTTSFVQKCFTCNEFFLHRCFQFFKGWITELLGLAFQEFW